MKFKNMLVYSCSGCSSVAQLANDVAIKLDREGLCEMSCLAGVGARVPSLLKKAQKTEVVLVVDGCPLSCGGHCFDQVVGPQVMSIDLSKIGIRKRFHESYTGEEFEQAWNYVLEILNHA